MLMKPYFPNLVAKKDIFLASPAAINAAVTQSER